MMQTTPVRTVHGLLQTQAERNPDGIAIRAPGRTPLTFAELLEHIRRTVATLHAVGVRRGDRVALVIPNGPEMTSALLAISAGTAAAPLNPAYRRREFDFYLTELDPKVLIIPRGFDSPARALAHDRDIAVLELGFDGRDAAGHFQLDGDRGDSRRGAMLSPEFADPDDLALLLHTSGTTSQPKVVPLTQRNVCASAADVCRTLELGPADLCLNLMPLFHIGGLVDLTLAPLCAGGSTVCTPGFSTTYLFDWLDEFRPTWFQAVPAMLREILGAAHIRRAAAPRHRLRFVRSVAAPLSSDVRRGIEEAFRCPVVETYGMTEASPLITSTALPPGARKPGSLGRSVGPDIAILDAEGNALPCGETGEIAIRGENVTSGYANDPEANARSFANGWFKTGDLGALDEEGFLFLRGRAKEMINRGGEKITPAEIEGVLTEHPAVAEAAAFAMPHRLLGEEVAAAVVLARGADASLNEIVAFAGERLAEFKIPRALRIADELPRNSIGKLQRAGLAERFGLNDDKAAIRERVYVEPRDDLERHLVAIWEEILDFEPVGIRDDFFALGGYSLLGVRMLETIESELGGNLPLTALSHSVTVEQLANLLRQERSAESWSPLAPIRATGSRPPFFCCHALVGHVVQFRSLALLLSPEQPFFGLQARGLDGTQPPHESIEKMAADYVDQIRRVDPRGPYYLGGFSLGGFVAYEMARQLRARGAEVALLALIDCTGPRPQRSNADEIVSHARNLFRLKPREIPTYLWKVAGKEARRGLRRLGLAGVLGVEVSKTERQLRMLGVKLGPRERRVAVANLKALRAYEPGAYDGTLTVFRAGIRPPRGYSDRHAGWSGLVPSVEIREIPGDHNKMMKEPHIRLLAEALGKSLDQARERVARGKGGATRRTRHDSPVGFGSRTGP
jgi:acyl-CoA synthetase (AMP-forming)/AMP-acid ligase II/thioesterase domain-containing protein